MKAVTFKLGQSIMLATLVLNAGKAWGEGEILGETKEQLKLKYEVSVYDHGTGRVTVKCMIADEGRLKPLSSVDLKFPSKDKFKDGGHMVDLSLSVATTKEDGKLVARVHLKKEWAERAEICLSTSFLDGKQLPLTTFHHAIPLARYVKNASGPANPAAVPVLKAAPPAAQAPATEQKKNNL